MRKQIPILFSTPMVQAILDGRKTMTRRVMKPKDTPYLVRENSFVDWSESFGWVVKHKICDNPERFEITQHFKCPYGQPGDILWVRESFKNDGWVENEGFDGLFYKADYPNEPVKWKPSIHMPKSACRIWLEITDVRVERLQDMDGAHAEECDSLKEGIMKFHHGDGNYGYHWKGDMDGKNFVHPFDAFVDLWKSINGPESWEANPWVWVVEFKILSTTGKPSDI